MNFNDDSSNKNNSLDEIVELDNKDTKDEVEIVDLPSENSSLKENVTKKRRDTYSLATSLICGGSLLVGLGKFNGGALYERIICLLGCFIVAFGGFMMFLNYKNEKKTAMSLITLFLSLFSTGMFIYFIYLFFAE